MKPLVTFNFEGKVLRLLYVETVKVAWGVTCDVYEIVGDKNRDLGIIRIKPGCKSPKQKVLFGKRTTEGFVSGKGKLTITKPNAVENKYQVGKEPFSIDVKVGETMQWEAASHCSLVAYEICDPPYTDGRYQNL